MGETPKTGFRQKWDLWDQVILGGGLAAAAVFLALFFISAHSDRSADRTGTPLATLNYSSGAPSYKPKSDWSWLPVRKETTFFAGDSIRTDEKSRVILQVGRNLLRVEPSSYLVLRKDGEKVGVDLKLGELIPEMENSADFVLRADSNAGAKIAPIQKVKPEYLTAPATATRLTLLEPSEDLKLISSGLRPVSFPVLWTALDGSAAVELALDEKFQTLLLRRELSTRGAQITIPNTKAGMVFMRLKHLTTNEISPVRRIQLIHVITPNPVSPGENVQLDLNPVGPFRFEWTQVNNATYEIEYSVDGRSPRTVPVSVPHLVVDRKGMGLIPPEPARVSWRVRTKHADKQFSDWSALRVTNVIWPVQPLDLRLASRQGLLVYNAEQFKWTCAQPLVARWSAPVVNESLQLEWSQSPDFKETTTRFVRGSQESICLSEPGRWYFRMNGLNREGKRIRVSPRVEANLLLPAPTLKDKIAYRFDANNRFKVSVNDPVGDWHYEFEVNEPSGKGEIQKVDPQDLLLTLKRPTSKIVRTRVRSPAGDLWSDWSAPQNLQVLQEYDPRQDVQEKVSAFEMEASKPVYLTGSKDRVWTRLSWKPLNGAKTYEIQVSPSSDFKDIAQSYTTEKLHQVAIWDGVRPMYWRIRAVFSNDQPSPWSRIQSVKVNRLPAAGTPRSPTPELPASKK